MNNLAIDEIYSPFSFPASSVFTFDARSPAATGLFPSKKYLHDNVPARPNCNALMDCHTPVSAVADTTSASTPAANEVSTPDPTLLSNTSAGAADAAIAIARSVNKTRRQLIANTKTKINLQSKSAAPCNTPSPTNTAAFKG